MTPATPHYHITLLRHGQSEGNVKGLFQGQSDYPLSELGRQQALALAEHWLGEEMVFEYVIASPLSRARETAEIISSTLQIPLQTDPIWMEQDFGKLSERNMLEFAQSEDRPRFFHTYQHAGETGESRTQLFARAALATQSLIDHAPGQYLVVSHGALLNTVMYAILGITPQPNLDGPRFVFRNTSFATLSYIPDRHQWHVLGFNDYKHLNGKLITT